MLLVIIQAVAVMTINTKGFQYSLQAMHLSNTSVATMCNFAISFVFSGILGWALFGEHVSAQWAAGMALVLAGVYCLRAEEPRAHEPKTASLWDRVADVTYAVAAMASLLLTGALPPPRASR
jgi:drug/metabolite transporter (DMT)-like permease